MPRSAANRSAWPGVGEQTATTDAPGTRRKASAWIAETKPLPIRPTRTVSEGLMVRASALLGPGTSLLRRPHRRRREAPGDADERRQVVGRVGRYDGQRHGLIVEDRPDGVVDRAVGRQHRMLGV